MAIDRFIRWTDEVPTRARLAEHLRHYLSDAGSVEDNGVALFGRIAGRPSGLFRDLDPDLHCNDRFIEVYIGPADETPRLSIDIITRMADEFTCDLADGFARRIAQRYRAILDKL